MVFLFLVFILWIQLSRYEIEESNNVPVQNQQNRVLYKGQILNLMLWNISYGGMPAEMDFFYSGGTQMMVKEERFHENFEAIKNQIAAAKDSLDIILLQKVDTNSKRSYYQNQVEQLHQLLPEFEYSYCLNFSVPFIPVPLDKPIGKTHSGMMNFSRFKTDRTTRTPLNQKTYYWPKRLFTAQRCVNMTTYHLGDKSLHILNAHLDSYDFQGEIRLAQLQKIWHVADSLEKRGDYIIIAGGWNMNPPEFKKYRIKNGYLGKPSYPEIDSTIYFSNWTFEHRMDIPTSRSLREAYRHGAISSSIKDFFICSPNIGILEVNTAHQQFQHSDHQAVFLEVFLLP